MARTKQQVRGMLYNIRSVIDGLIKILEATAMNPDDVEKALFDSIANEAKKGNTQDD